MSRPAFSVVICNYNLAEYVGAAIESVLGQDYPAALREVIVVDDGSTDDSLARLEPYAGRAGVTVVHQANGGQTAALGSGVARARGDFVCLLDSDDWFLPHKLSRVAARLTEIPGGGDVVLMHDYAIYDEQRGVELEPSWFATLKGPLGADAELADPAGNVRVAIPCGQVYSRALIQALCEGIPNADFPYGADVVIGHGAFIAARRLYYLHEPLAVYRVHAGNEMAGVDEVGRYTARNAIAVLGRWPKQLRYFEALVESLPGDVRARQERLAYIARLAGAMHSTSASLGPRGPLMSFIVLTNGSDDAVEATRASIAAQTYAATETVVVGHGKSAGPPAVAADRWVQVAPDAPRLACLAAGFGVARGEFLAFVPAGDRVDRVFAERLVHILQYGTPAMQVVCDVRMVDGRGALLQSSPFRAGGEWRYPVDYLAPLKTAPHETLFPPIAAAVMRRSRYLGHLFAAAGSPPARQAGAQAEWLVQQFAHALGGTILLSECHVSHRVEDGATAAWSIRTAASNPDGSAAREPESDAAVQLLMSVYCSARDDFRRVYPETWHAELVAWLSYGRPPETVAALRAIAGRYGDRETLDILDALAELRD